MRVLRLSSTDLLIEPSPGRKQSQVVKGLQELWLHPTSQSSCSCMTLQGGEGSLTSARARRLPAHPHGFALPQCEVQKKYWDPKMEPEKIHSA